MAKVVLTGDGQSFDIEDEIAKDDELLRSVVKSVSPAYTNPTFRRETKEGVMAVHVSKQAGTKGAGAIDALKSLPEEQSPLVALRAQMDELARQGRLTIDSAFELEPQVREAVAASHSEREILRRAVRKLLSSETVPSPFVPTGF